MNISASIIGMDAGVAAIISCADAAWSAIAATRHTHPLARRSPRDCPADQSQAALRLNLQVTNFCDCATGILI